MGGRSREDDRRDGAAPTAFAVECPGCRTHVAVNRGLVGRVAGCPRCRTAFIVPVPGPVERRPPEAPRPAPAAPVRSPDEPVVFSEPPVPSTRRLRDGSPAAAPVASTQAAQPIDDTTTMAATTPAVAANALDGLAFRAPIKIIRSGSTEIELRRLTPEERQARRARRNLIILVVGAALLVALVVILGTRDR